MPKGGQPTYRRAGAERISLGSSMSRVEKQGIRGSDQPQAWNRPGPGVESSWVVSGGSALEAFLGHFPVPFKIAKEIFKKSAFCV